MKWTHGKLKYISRKPNKCRRELRCTVSTLNLTCVFVCLDLNWMRSGEEWNRSFTVQEQLTYVFRARAAYLRQKLDIYRKLSAYLTQTVIQHYLKLPVVQSNYELLLWKQIIRQKRTKSLSLNPLLSWCNSVHTFTIYFSFSLILSYSS
jgi:hypothetical protein